MIGLAGLLNGSDLQTKSNRVFFHIHLSSFRSLPIVWNNTLFKFCKFVSFCCTFPFSFSYSTLHILQKLPIYIVSYTIAAQPYHTQIKCNEGNKNQEEIETHEKWRKKLTRVSKQKRCSFKAYDFDISVCVCFFFVHCNYVMW